MRCKFEIAHTHKRQFRTSRVPSKNCPSTFPGARHSIHSPLRPSQNGCCSISLKDFTVQEAFYAKFKLWAKWRLLCTRIRNVVLTYPYILSSAQCNRKRISRKHRSLKVFFMNNSQQVWYDFRYLHFLHYVKVLGLSLNRIGNCLMTTILIYYTPQQHYFLWKINQRKPIGCTCNLIKSYLKGLWRRTHPNSGAL